MNTQEPALKHTLEETYSGMSGFLMAHYESFELTNYIMTELMPPISEINSRLLMDTDSLKSSWLIPSVDLVRAGTKQIDDAVLLTTNWNFSLEIVNSVRTLRLPIEFDLCYGLEDKLDVDLYA